MRVVEHDSSSMKVAVIEVLQHSIVKDTLTIVGVSNGGLCGISVTSFRIGDTLLIGLKDSNSDSIGFGLCSTSYLWFSRGQVVGAIRPGITSQTYENFKAGIGACTGMARADSLEIYPNPVHHTVKIRFPNKFSEVYSLGIYDSTGRLIRLYQNLLSGRLEIDMADLPPGMYFVQVNSKESTVTRKLLVAR